MWPVIYFDWHVNCNCPSFIMSIWLPGRFFDFTFFDAADVWSIYNRYPMTINLSTPIIICRTGSADALEFFSRISAVIIDSSRFKNHPVPVDLLFQLTQSFSPYPLSINYTLHKLILWKQVIKDCIKCQKIRRKCLQKPLQELISKLLQGSFFQFISASYFHHTANGAIMTLLHRHAYLKRGIAPWFWSAPFRFLLNGFLNRIKTVLKISLCHIRLMLPWHLPSCILH